MKYESSFLVEGFGLYMPFEGRRLRFSWSTIGEPGLEGCFLAWIPAGPYDQSAPPSCLDMRLSGREVVEAPREERGGLGEFEGGV